MKGKTWGLLTCILLTPVAVQAVPITLTFTGTDASYSLNDQQAMGDFSVEFHADTSNVFENFEGTRSYLDLIGTITLSGVGTGTFETAYVFVNPAGASGEAVGFGTEFEFGAGPIGDVFDLIATGQGLATYDLTTDFGPISTTELFALFQWIALPTTLGSLTVFSVREGTFQATTASVSEPGTLSLLGLGMFGLGLTRRRAN